MHFCLRIDLDYVPWDTPDASEFGHGEPAMLLRLLDVARHRGYKYHFFASNRTLRAFPASAEAVLNEGHDLDWFCKHPEDPQRRFEDALNLFASFGHVPKGLCVRGPWPAEVTHFAGIDRLQFLTSAPGPCPPGLKHFPVEVRSLRESVRGGATVRGWCDAVKTAMRDASSRNKDIVVTVRPQVHAKHDPKLHYLREILELTVLTGLRMTTLRSLV
jgi:hypothetical protein